MSYPQRPDDDGLAYGDDYLQSRGSGGQDGTDRSLLGDTFKKFKSEFDKYKTSSSSSSQNYGYSGSGPGSNQQYYGHQGPSTGYPQIGQSAYPGGPPTQQAQGRPDLASKLFDGLHNTLQNIGSDVTNLLGPGNRPPAQYGPPAPGQTSYAGYTSVPGPQGIPPGPNRYDSFASEKQGNDVKWYVDGCGYFWAVSQALEGAKHSIWILDWWLSPELYLRRPPSQNEQWRLDRTLQRAAQRGVKVKVIVYKEVTQALTLSSAHTKHELEKLHPNIAVFRHPDHLPDAQTTQSSLISSLQALKLDAAGLTKLGADAIKGVYGMTDDVILYWAHHEKLCLIDDRIAFMGGLDLCFGRWDTNQHSIADAHPSNMNDIVFPGQDYNNARVMDFSDVAQPFQNKLDRTKNSRMGWSDIAICLQGACVQDLRHHFIDRWNFIFDEKYNVRKDQRYYRLLDDFPHPATGPGQRPQSRPQSQGHLQPPAPAGGYAPPPGSQPYTEPAWHTTSRPHTPTTGQYQAQAGPNTSAYGSTATPSVQGTQIQSQQSEVPYGQTMAPSSQGAQTQPPMQHPPQTSVGSYGQIPPPPSQAIPQPVAGPYGQVSSPPQQVAPVQHPPAQSFQQSFPPPPPGPPPQASTAPTQTYPGYPPPPSANPPYAPYHQGPTELSSQQSPSQSYQNQPYQPYQQAGPEQARGFDEYNQESTRGFDDYGQGNESGRGFGGERGFRGRIDQYKTEGKLLGQQLSSIGNVVSGGLGDKAHQLQGKYLGGTDSYGRPYSQPRPVMTCQVLRSCTTWSNGTPLEHSIQNAYIDIIRNSQHFVYIENQFFITATGDQQKPVKNLIGQAIVERILRAARNNEKYKMIVVIPAVPAFAGDLRDDSSLATRAIMEFQYNSINRGGHSIMEKIAQAGFNPMDYIRFYNLRNYDRINCSNTMQQVEQQSGVRYEDARKQHDDAVGAGYGQYGEKTGTTQLSQAPQYQQYQSAAQQMATPGSGRWDSVAECYMLGGQDIRTVPWDGPPESELDAFVSEELYIHSKCLIADDRIVILGSANLNDRSQLGSHDSEIALLINDSTPVQTYMNGQPYQASGFAASLRRQLARKHLGLIRPQHFFRPDPNFEPVGVPNAYDWGSPEDNVVADPLSDTFQALWNSRARTNTEVFRKAFRAIPDDYVNTWADYKEFYEYFYNHADVQAQGKPSKLPPRVEYGHVVRADFPGGVTELKELLSQVKGTLVEMPLCFLQNEDIAKEGLTLNPLTEEVYT
ncbi:uncharacterized protein Z519_01500 [Cladophialophora bantiana CBS 173.52]|uniref:phospholipase D n=1 Tax=Cladophialophora bantiana (strain ATCC 10958 / CBS 173.52 / CDC B-1940 / NIH 8579) TaxID=1442370 RepID=A0A0D2F728_CLAB1|nr:uncharacterized protein Z519_01500 [Cladophialophora bantiana CBS 173.52]KIW97916.1 hypothetical protein Z519_01500 [Cladophialophora bantiana CBS 173.52]